MEKTPEQASEWKPKYFENERIALHVLKDELQVKIENDNKAEGSREGILLNELEEGVFSDDLDKWLDEYHMRMQSTLIHIVQSEDRDDNDMLKSHVENGLKMWEDFAGLVNKKRNR